MTDLSVRPLDEKRILISGIPTILAAMLREVPEVLELRDSPDARARLYPDPTRGNNKINQEWHQMAGPELRHLFVSAGETMTRDLTALTEDKEHGDAWQVAIPIEHVPAWISALNQARLILGQVHKIDDVEMNRTDLDPQNPKHLAALRIHLLGYLLHLFIEMDTPHEPENHI